MFPVVYLLGASLFTIRAFRNFIQLSDASIEVNTLTVKATLPLDKIEGRRTYIVPGDENSPDVRHLVIQPNDDRFPKLDIEDLYQFDGTFYSWFNALRDIDELDKHTPKTSNFGLV